MTVADAGVARSPIKGHCPECGPNRNADIAAEYRTSFDYDEIGIWGATNYRILQCRGCEHVYFQTSEVFSEHTDHKQDPITGEWHVILPEKISYYPSPVKRGVPTWALSLDVVDSDLGDLFGDIYKALNVDLRVLAAIAIRTVFDRSSELMEIDSAITFVEKLDALLSQGKISADEKEGLSVLADAGSAAAHRGWRPGPREIDTMVSLLEAFLHRTFVLGDEAKTLKAKIPTKAKRRSAPEA